MSGVKIGDHVAYWTRRRGESARLVRGVVKQLSDDGELARVRLDVPGPMISVRSVETKRLQRVPEHEVPRARTAPEPPR